MSPCNLRFSQSFRLLDCDCLIICSLIDRASHILCRGAVPGPVLVGPPGQQSSSSVDVWDRVRFHALFVWFCLPKCDAHFIGWCWVGVARGLAKRQDIFFGVFVLCWVGCQLLRHRGRSCSGGCLYPSVLQSPGVSPQKCRAAHGPLHPAVTYPLRLCWICVRFSVGFFPGSMLAVIVGVVLSLRLACCLFFRPLGPKPCLP